MEGSNATCLVEFGLQRTAQVRVLSRVGCAAMTASAATAGDGKGRSESWRGNFIEALE